MGTYISKALIKKDLKDIFRSKTLLVTMIIIPIVFSVIFPSVVLGGALLFDAEKIAGDDGQKLIDALLTSTKGDEFASYTLEQQIIYMFINFILPTLFLLVPIITAMTVAGNSFVGEKENRTLESLLFSPISIKTLFLSKILASLIPPLFVSIISFVVCGVIINSLGYPLFGELIFPSGNWLALITCLSPMVILLSVLLNILISARVRTYQEAQNLGGIIVLPVIAMMIGQVSGLFLLGVQLIILISVGILIVNLLLWSTISKNNDRYVLFEKQIH
ncbi:ABC transporter permease subunit [Lederbergia citrea]|uniref:ABC transporter permease subunit n=1 Tax=Lederbergia citrea TaxID=2833581 RepID=A0A942Z247_9BACI|nr:ABC transporter permease subunit [Lederbergia citrea]MBS4176635.1 ABC transporter permease subunit [Lederbergia citrea]MBS4222133.1 ABC transporter permease subunit [Lederbergia citrea]